MNNRLNIQHITARCTVRLLTPEDVPAMLELAKGNPIFYQHLHEEPTAEGFLEDLTNLPPRTTPEDKYYAGYFRDGRLIGALDLITGFPAPETAFVGFFMLHKDVQGAGLGSALIGDLLAFLKDAGFRAVRLMYVKGNPQSAAFWTKNGFTPTGVEPKQENYTQVVLERTL